MMKPPTQMPTNHPISSGAIAMGKWIIFLMPFSLLADSITGWMQMQGITALSVVQVYRSTMLLLIFYWLARYWDKGFKIVFSLIAFSMLLIFYHGLSATTNESPASDLRFNLSIYANLIYFIFLYGFLLKIKSNPASLLSMQRACHRILRLSFYIIAINIGLGAFDIGYSTLGSYVIDDDATSGGGKGFFIAGNDLSCVVILVAGFILIQAWQQRSLLAYLLLSLFIVGLAILVQLKTAILGSLLLMMLIPLAVSGLSIKGRLNFKALTPIFLGVGAASILLSWLIASNSALFRRASYLMDKEGLLTAIFTGRNNFMVIAIDTWDKRYSLADQWFGLGWEGFLDAMKLTMGIQKNIEIDYADILMMNGILGLLVVVFIWFWYLRLNFNLLRKTRIARAVLLIDIFMLLLAGTSGHILYSAMNGLFVALLNILPLLEYELNHHEKSTA